MTKKNRFLLSALFALTIMIFNGCVTDPATGDQANANNSNAPAQKTGGPDPSRSAGSPAQPREKTGLGKIQVSSRPEGATVLLISEDEGGAGTPQPRGSTPTIINDVAPGKYTVHLELRGYKSFQKSIEVKADKTATVKAGLRKN
ncbi:MAG: PEGA domain-containing protein [Blastocatellia bacterium]|nr:PEGA domain-containing protein [Blastocatellia bacterium]